MAAMAIVVAGCGGRSGGPEQAEEPLARAATIPEQRELIGQHVADPGKKRQALAVVDIAEAQVEEFEKWHRQHQRRMVRLAADYDSTRADFEAAAGRFDRQYGRLLRLLLELRMELRDLTTDEEWARIAGGPTPSAE